ncbi:hypothetical protein LCGC14_1430200 [marine sediment metagenome]|uniref:Uncharacterized protein n=1 Tax=marine sediment metagenome TaxID=412755 RepID=A0A0F9MQK1_9ZZZZ
MILKGEEIVTLRGGRGLAFSQQDVNAALLGAYAQHTADVKWLGGECKHKSKFPDSVKVFKQRWDCFQCRAEFVAAGKE